MALLRDLPFTAIEDETCTDVVTVVQALDSMPWFDGSNVPTTQAHNTAQNSSATVTPKPTLPSGFAVVADDKNFLLPMAFPEGSPTHPAYGAGNATVAGACVTVLKAFFEMFDADGVTAREWPGPVFVADFQDGSGGNANEGGELVAAPGSPTLTTQGELDKLAMKISNARNMAGVHYDTDYYESIRLGERIAVSILEEHLSMYRESVSMAFTSFGGEHVRISANGESAELDVSVDGTHSTAREWFTRVGI